MQAFYDYAYPCNGNGIGGRTMIGLVDIATKGLGETVNFGRANLAHPPENLANGINVAVSNGCMLLCYLYYLAVNSNEDWSTSSLNLQDQPALI